MVKHIPNLITCMNLFSGCLGLWFLRMGMFDKACYMVFLAAAFDFFDGFAARALNANSPIGKELDSLADIVSFGVLPSFLLANLIAGVTDNYTIDGTFAESVIHTAPFLIAVFSALRLAKFNIDTRQSDEFLGLPTPMNAILMASIPLILTQHILWLNDIILNMYTILALIFLSCFLLVSEIPLMALKFKTWGFKENVYKYIFLFSAVILILTLKIVAIPVIFLLYILISLIGKKRRNEIQS